METKQKNKVMFSKSRNKLSLEYIDLKIRTKEGLDFI